MSGVSAAERMSTAADETAAISDFTRGFSVEATRPTADDVAALAAIVRPGTRVYISAVVNRPLTEAIDAAIQLRRAGLEPVPHIAVRNFAGAQDLETFLARLCGDVVRLPFADRSFDVVLATAPGYADYTTPIRGLYQCSSATHAGGGVTGIPAYLATRRIFADRGWPVIDVTRRSIEETAAAIINLLGERDGAGPA